MTERKEHGIYSKTYSRPKPRQTVYRLHGLRKSKYMVAKERSLKRTGPPPHPRQTPYHGQFVWSKGKAWEEGREGVLDISIRNKPGKPRLGPRPTPQEVLRAEISELWKLRGRNALDKGRDWKQKAEALDREIRRLELHNRPDATLAEVKAAIAAISAPEVYMGPPVKRGGYWPGHPVVKDGRLKFVQKLEEPRTAGLAAGLAEHSKPDWREAFEAWEEVWLEEEQEETEAEVAVFETI